MSRDPIEDRGGLNEYGLVGNDPVSRWDYLGHSWVEVLAWFGEWLNGKGEAFKAFGPGSNAASDMKNAPGVNKARAFFRAKNKSVRCCKDLSSVRNYKTTFGLAGLFAAGFNSTQQFIGRYRIDIFVSGCKKNRCEIDFELTNTTSFKSFLYGIGPSWHREEFRFMGNVTQVIWWTEEYDAKCP